MCWYNCFLANFSKNNVFDIVFEIIQWKILMCLQEKQTKSLLKVLVELWTTIKSMKKFNWVIDYRIGFL